VFVGRTFSKVLEIRGNVFLKTVLAVLIKSFYMPNQGTIMIQKPPGRRS
jgi:hypothetical protein